MFYNKWVLSDFDRQYVGAIDKNGHKIIWIVCFCKNERYQPYWDSQPRLIMDGGDWNDWNVKIDLTDNKYYDLQINGEG